MLKWSLAVVAAVLAWFTLTGCASMQPYAFPQEFSRAAGQVATALTAESAWDQIAASLDGQVIDPGVEGWAGVLYVAGGKLRGVSGQVGLRGTGASPEPPGDDTRAALLHLAAHRPDLLEQLLAFLRDRDAPAPAPAPEPPIEPDADGD